MSEYDRDCWDECPEYPPYPPRPVRVSAIVSGPFQVSSGASVIVDVQNLVRVNTDVVVKLIPWDSTAPTGVGDVFFQTILDLRPGRVGAVEFPTNVIAPGTYEVEICPERRVNLKRFGYRTPRSIGNHYSYNSSSIDVS